MRTSKVVRVLGVAAAFGLVACAPAGPGACDGGCPGDASTPSTPDERLLSPPAECGAPLGGACVTNAECDLGLTCTAGACACTGVACTLSCDPGKPDRLRAAAGRVFYLRERASGEWAVVSLAVSDAAMTVLATGAGAAALALDADEVFVAFEPGVGRTQLDRMALDGGGRAAVPSWSLPLPYRWFAVTADDFLVGRDREVVAVQRADGQQVLVAGGLQVNVPRWFLTEGRRLYWLNDNIDSSLAQDTVMSVSLDDVASGGRMQASDQGIRQVLPCGGEIFFSGSSGVYRLEREPPDSAFVGPPTSALGCQDDARLSSEAREGTARALVRRRLTGSEEALLTLQFAGVLNADSLTSVGGFVVWTTSSGGPWRVLRLRAP